MVTLTAKISGALSTTPCSLCLRGFDPKLALATPSAIMGLKASTVIAPVLFCAGGRSR